MIKSLAVKTKSFGEALERVVLAAKRDDKNAARIRVVAELREHVRRRLVVLAHLRAAVGVRQREPAARLREALCEAVHAADERNDPDVVANTDATVGMSVAEESLLRLDSLPAVDRGFVRLVFVLEDFAEVRLHVMDVNVLALRDRLCRVADRHAVLDDVLALGDVAKSVLVPVLANLDVVVRIDYHAPNPK